MSSHRADFKSCARCGLVRVTRGDRGLYCRDCASAAKPEANRWMQWGACRGVAYQPDWWWPQTAQDENIPVALGICHYCKVRDLCLDYAIQHNEREGIWGGMLPHERQRIRAAQRKAVS